MFICAFLSIKLEKCRFSVFALSWKATSTMIVPFRQPEAFTPDLWILRSDSECGLLLPILIMDSYTLNVPTNETIASQDRTGKGGIIR
jgi:hypothetical protein